MDRETALKVPIGHIWYDLCIKMNDRSKLLPTEYKKYVHHTDNFENFKREKQMGKLIFIGRRGGPQIHIEGMRTMRYIGNFQTKQWLFPIRFSLTNVLCAVGHSYLFFGFRLIWRKRLYSFVYRNLRGHMYSFLLEEIPTSTVTGPHYTQVYVSYYERPQYHLTHTPALVPIPVLGLHAAFHRYLFNLVGMIQEKWGKVPSNGLVQSRSKQHCLLFAPNWSLPIPSIVTRTCYLQGSYPEKVRKSENKEDG